MIKTIIGLGIIISVLAATLATVGTNNIKLRKELKKKESE